jgi:hypothetical protein
MLISERLVLRTEEKMAEIKVTRKAYVRKDGTAVKAATYLIQDKGQPGKTPESKKFFHPDVKMNWHKDDPMATRRANALKAHHGDELATGRALQELANVTTDQATARQAKVDADYFFAKHK